MPIRVTSLDHLVLNVADIARSATWYATVLGMEVRTSHLDGGKTPRTALHFGPQKINIRPVSTSKSEWFTADHEAAGSDDLCFLTDAKPLDVVAHLQSCGVEIQAGPVKRDGARGKMISVYCRDPDGNLIEVASYKDER